MNVDWNIITEYDTCYDRGKRMLGLLRNQRTSEKMWWHLNHDWAGVCVEWSTSLEGLMGKRWIMRLGKEVWAILLRALGDILTTEKKAVLSSRQGYEQLQPQCIYVFMAENGRHHSPTWEEDENMDFRIKQTWIRIPVLATFQQSTLGN